MSISEPSALPNGLAASPGTFERRAKRVVSNAALYDLVQDMAGSVDCLNGKVDGMSRKLDQLLSHLGAAANADDR